MLAVDERVGELRHLVKADQDPRLRHRARPLRMLARGASVLGVARCFRNAPQRVGAWRG